MRRPGILIGAIVAFLLGTIGSATADSNRGEDQAKKFRADLKGFEEIPTLSTPGTGKFEARLSHDGQSVDYELEYQDTESNVRQAHIHLGAPAFNGGIMVFLCTNLGNGPPGTPLCPATGGAVQGTFTAAEVIGGAEAQGVSPGEFEEVIRAMQAGAAYANVHTETRQGGEIRGQINDD
ncbi:MAG: CHRD domain-containing protein [Thermoanaerobaculia bacterium]